MTSYEVIVNPIANATTKRRLETQATLDTPDYPNGIEISDAQMKELMMACVKAQMIPPGVKGLIPDGDITMLWRWLGPVYEDSTQDILNNSIVVRNLQELGVDSIEALKYLFPSKDHLGCKSQRVSS